MNLLPKSSQDFSKTDYWNSFFKKRGTKAFEWYGEYPELSEYLHKYIKVKDDILMVGCGNSTLSADLYDVGFRNITNVDISQVVIKQMIQSHKYERPNMQFIQMDALNMTFDDNKFNVIIDKGTLDALMTDESDEVDQRVTKYFDEISRVLRLAGRYVCISLLQEHIIKKVMNYFANENWMVRIVRCHEAEKKSKEEKEGLVMPVFIVIATKFAKLPQTLLEICLSGQKVVRMNSPDEICKAVLNAQNVAVITNGLAYKHLDETDEIFLELTTSDGSDVRYTVHVLDQSLARKTGAFAAFIVPQGRELDWMFSTKEGRKELLKSAGFNRLAIVTMHRYQNYNSLDDVKAELAESIRNLAPKGISGQIPFLSLGNDVGKREIIYQGNSEYSGDFVIEEVSGENGDVYRRLVFLQNQYVIQSESKLKFAKGRKGRKISTIDFGYLACNHHIYMTVGISLATLDLTKSSVGSVVIIGLGGGGLCSFLHKCFDNLKITAVDIDAEMLKIAQKYFGLTCNEKLLVSIDDGLKYLQKAIENDEKFDAILFDVDSKDTSVGMSCPPKKFLEESVLKNVNNCLNQNGYFILNLVCRDEDLKLKTISDLKSAFKNVSSYRIDQEVNEIFFCTNKSLENWKCDFQKASNAINTNVIKNKLQQKNLIDVDDFVKSLKFINNKN